MSNDPESHAKDFDKKAEKEKDAIIQKFEKCLEELKGALAQIFWFEGRRAQRSIPDTWFTLYTGDIVNSFSGAFRHCGKGL